MGYKARTQALMVVFLEALLFTLWLQAFSDATKEWQSEPNRRGLNGLS